MMMKRLLQPNKSLRVSLTTRHHSSTTPAATITTTFTRSFTPAMIHRAQDGEQGKKSKQEAVFEASEHELLTPEKIDDNLALRSRIMSRKIDNQSRLIDEEPVNFQPKTYERIREYIQQQENRQKRDEEEEEYRYQDPLLPRKGSEFRKVIANYEMKTKEDLLDFFGFSELAPIIDKTTLETLAGMNPLIANYVLIDVRGRMTAQHYKIPGSVNIPLTEVVNAFELTSEEFLSRYGIEKPSPITNIIFFSEDMIETEFACQLLSGFVDNYHLVYNYRGGVQDWFGATYKQLWRRSAVSDYNILLRYDRYGRIKKNMIRSVKELTEDGAEE